MGLLREAIEGYTGLSPTAFFTILALMLGVYQLVSSMFVFDHASQQDLNKKKKKSPQTPTLTQESEAAAAGNSVLFQNNNAVGENIGEVSEEELRAYDGSDPTKPLLMAIKAQIYDVSPSRLFYGPGGPYALFAGRDASRALALMSFDPNDLTGNIEGLDASELEVLQDWEYKFQEKYMKVGHIVAQGTRNSGSGSSDNQDAPN